MTTQTKPLNAIQLVNCLAGDLLVDHGLIVETIQEDQDLRHLVRSYAHGDFTYNEVLETIKEFF